MMQKENVLIVGQGIAGTLMAFRLLEAGIPFKVIDNHHKGAASKVAIGLVNPITGKRLVKSWKIEALMAELDEVIPRIEKLLDIRVANPRNIIRVIKNPGEENKWLSRSADPGYDKFFKDPADPSEFLPFVKPFFSYGELQHGGNIELAVLVEHFKDYLLKKGLLKQEAFDYEALFPLPGEVAYKNDDYTKVIFCEGAAGRLNPYFSYLPFEVSKGEAVIIRIPGVHFQKVFKHGIAIVPFKDDLYWVGSTNSWDFKNDSPEAPQQEELIQSLNEILTVDFEVIEPRAAIRPSVKDRRPYVGKHPKFHNLFILNGLGTKGTSLPLIVLKCCLNSCLKINLLIRMSTLTATMI
ncbi:MAG: FAD-dependent oxidoreductase [Saprospiraceae bacterium]